MATHPRQVRDLPDDLRAILQALPTKADFEALPSKTDIETLIQRVEEAHARDIQEIRKEMQTISERVDAGESSISALTQRVKDLEQSRETQAATAVDLQLHLEDLEDRSRRNNLRLRGIPEATGAEDLEATVLAILQGVLDTPQTSTELDRVHRTLGPRPSDPDRPRDVLCRVHRYTQKDLVLRKAWERGEVMFDGAEIKILPDLSRATLQRRAMLKPILELARGLGCTYRWGYPLAVTFRNSTASFTLRTPSELSALFTFLGSEPIEAPNWLTLVPRFARRPGLSAQRHPPPRQQRSRRRSRAPSNEGTRES